MERSLPDLFNDIRYAERLSLRTARLYRRLHTAATFLTAIGGSAALSALAPAVPGWVSVAGAACLAAFGALSLTVRPAEKAAAAEADAKRYAQLRTAGRTMSAVELQAAVEKAREADAAEIEPLRDVAWNDVAREIGRADAVVQLTPQQKLLAALA
jgi:hypothetical protein